MTKHFVRQGNSSRIHGTLLRELVTHMMENPRNIVFCAHLLFCSKIWSEWEITTNIAESVHYMVTGSG